MAVMTFSVHVEVRFTALRSRTRYRWSTAAPSRLPRSLPFVPVVVWCVCPFTLFIPHYSPVACTVVWSVCTIYGTRVIDKDTSHSTNPPSAPAPTRSPCGRFTEPTRRMSWCSTPSAPMAVSCSGGCTTSSWRVKRWLGSAGVSPQPIPSNSHWVSWVGPVWITPSYMTGV